ncbi:MAG: amidohydrolase family protein, partial [Bacillota bacterium]|nr:amidohydrolase family protein [Bacillota bacterium]
MSQFLFIKNASQLLTLKGFSLRPAVKEEMNQLSMIENGAILMENGLIIAVGPTEDVEREYREQLKLAKIIDASGKIVLPGLVDPHTHLVYTGSREDEFNMRLNGATYMDIMNSGGGIYATTSKTRAASEEELYAESLKRLDLFLLHGVTTVEAKSGYGL